MKRKRHSAEQIISKLREAEVLLEIVADQALDMAILKDVASGKF